MSSEKLITVVCLIALAEEYEIFQKIFPMKADQSFEENIALEHEVSDENVRLISVLAEQMGSESAHKSAAVSIAKFSPDIFIVVGIAGGISKDVALGDVVVSNQIIDVLQNNKVSNRADASLVFDFAPNFYDIDAELISSFNFFSVHPQYRAKYEDWRLEAGCGLDQISVNSHLSILPKVAIGPVACGPVSTSKQFNEKLKKIHRKVLAIETESGGVFAALSKHKVPSIAVRGISDLADEKKATLESLSEGAVRDAAMRNACCLIKEIIRTARFHAVGLRKKYSPKSGQAEMFNLLAVDKSVINSLEVQIKERLGDLSAEFRNQPDGFYLPTPRVRRLVYDEDFGGSELQDPENLIETLVDNDRVFVNLPRTFPTQTLGWSLAYSLIKQPIGGAIVLPIHVDVDVIRPPRGKLVDSIPEQLRAQAMRPEFTQVFILEGVDFSSKTRARHLLKEIGRAGGKVLVLSRSEGNLADVERFVKEGDFTEFEMAPISFSETAFFLEKTFDMSPQEAEIVAIRLDDTFRKFRLDAHPTYFAGLQEETLAALIEANKRAELIQLAVDGLLSLIVAADKAKLKLSRSTRERFLRRLVLTCTEQKVDEQSLVRIADEFLDEFKFGVSPIEFVRPFLASGLLYFVDDNLRFSHPYLESYLLAQGLRDDPDRAREYFNPSSDFNHYAFDLYCEIGASLDVIEAIRSYADQAIHLGVQVSSGDHAFSDRRLKLTALANKGQLQSYRQGLSAQSKRLSDGQNDIREQKQQMLDARRHVRSEVNERQIVRRDAMPREVRAEFEALDQLSKALMLTATIVGSGSESLDGSTKIELANCVVRVAHKFSDIWTRNRARVDFDQLRTELLDDQKIWKFLEDHEIDGATFEAVKRDIELSLYGAELSSIMEPLSRVLWRVCSIAGVKVLQPVIDEVTTTDAIGEVIAATWLHDVDPIRGKLALKDAMKNYDGAPSLRLLLSSHLLWRVFWHHHKTAGASHFISSVDRMLAPLGMQPSSKRIEQVTRGATRSESNP